MFAATAVRGCREFVRSQIWRQLSSSVGRGGFNRMTDAKLTAVPAVDIEEGVFKYILIKVYGQVKDDGSEPHKLVVRGYKDCEWHSDIYERVSASCQGLGLDTECLGGGRIDHNPGKKTIKVYDKSQGYGRADHTETQRILLEAYPDYTVDVMD